MPSVYDDEKQKTGASDDELRKITGVSPDEEKDLDRRAYSGAAEDIAEAEALASTPTDTDADKSEKNDADPAEESGGWKTSVGRAKSNVGTAKKLGIAGGIAGALAIAVIALFS